MMQFRDWCLYHFPGGRFSEGGSQYLCKNHLRGDTNASLSFTNKDGGKYNDFGDKGGQVKFFCHENGLDVWDGAEPWTENSTRSDAPLPSRESSDAPRRLWESARPATEHPYCTRKGIAPDGCRVTSDERLLVPGWNENGEVVSIERISPDGTKRHYGPKDGAFFLVGDTTEDTPILCAEGFSTAATLHALTGWPVAASFGAGNLPKTVRVLGRVFPGREIGACPDADAAGAKAGDEAVLAGACVVSLPEGVPGHFDWNDCAHQHGVEITKEFFRDQWTNRRKKEKIVEKPSTAFTLRRIGDIPLTEPEFLVDDLLETDTLALFFGESGCRKTFAVFDIAASIATGAPYAGRQTKEGTVIYLAGEGTGGLPRRARAWELHRGISLKDAPLYTSSRAALFMDENGAKTVEDEVDRIAAESGAPSLIVIDTVARSMVGGDENSAKDTGIFIERVDALRRKYGASCILVHHSGIVDKGRLRGSSAWKGALDAEFLVSLDGDIVTLTCQKMKEAAEPAPISFRSHEYTVMIGKTGKEITSLALEPTDERPARVKELSKGLKYALDTYHAAAKEKPELDAEGKFIGVHVESWRPYFYEKATADSPDGKRQAFNRSIKKLVEERHLSVKNDVYTPVGEVDTVLVNRYAQRINHSSQRDTVTYRDMTVTCHAADDLERDKRDIILKDVTLSRSSVTLESETGVDVGGKPVLENELGAGLETPEQKPKTPYLELLKGGEHDADTKVS